MLIKSDDATIFYTTMGSGPDLVLLHPSPCNHTFWLPIASQLALTYRVVLPDLRGHGQSSPGEGPATMEKHAEDLVRICKELKIEKAIFAGVSIGGYVLMEFWKRYREMVRAFILADTRGAADTDDVRSGRQRTVEDVQRHGPQPYLDSMLEPLLGETTRRNRPDIVQAARATMQDSTVEGITAVQQGMAERPDYVTLLPTINVPTLLVFGSEDTVTPVSVGRFMQQNIPQSILRILVNAGHLALMEKPEDALRVIGSFLDQLQ